MEAASKRPPQIVFSKITIPTVQSVRKIIFFENPTDAVKTPNPRSYIAFITQKSTNVYTVKKATMSIKYQAIVKQ